MQPAEESVARGPNEDKLTTGRRMIPQAGKRAVQKTICTIVKAEGDLSKQDLTINSPNICPSSAALRLYLAGFATRPNVNVASIYNDLHGLNHKEVLAQHFSLLEHTRQCRLMSRRLEQDLC